SERPLFDLKYGELMGGHAGQHATPAEAAGYPTEADRAEHTDPQGSADLPTNPTVADVEAGTTARSEAGGSGVIVVRPADSEAPGQPAAPATEAAPETPATPETGEPKLVPPVTHAPGEGEVTSAVDATSPPTEVTERVRRQAHRKGTPPPDARPEEPR
ncbi:MAG: hypothetical protein ACR2JZ_00005, partial [Candidatus Limnocylindrales bacterium]